MYVVSKEKDRIVNMDMVMSLFIASDGCTVKAAFKNGSVSQIGEYSYPLAGNVVKMFANAVKSGADVFFMPADEAAKAAAEAENSRGHTERHAANGAVIRRHGGS